MGRSKARFPAISEGRLGVRKYWIKCANTAHGQIVKGYPTSNQRRAFFFHTNQLTQSLENEGGCETCLVYGINEDFGVPPR